MQAQLNANADAAVILGRVGCRRSRDSTVTYLQLAITPTRRSPRAAAPLPSRPTTTALAPRRPLSELPPRMTSSDIRSILNLPGSASQPSHPRPAAAAPPAKRQRPEGVSREVFALLGDHIPSVQAAALEAAAAAGSSLKFKEKPRMIKKAKPAEKWCVIFGRLGGKRSRSELTVASRRRSLPLAGSTAGSGQSAVSLARAFTTRSSSLIGPRPRLQQTPRVRLPRMCLHQHGRRQAAR